MWSATSRVWRAASSGARRSRPSVQSRTEALLGPFELWAVCPHGPHDGCDCHVTGAALVSEACRALGLPPARVTVIARSDAAIVAALSAGAHAIRVPEPEREVVGPCRPAP